MNKSIFAFFALTLILGCDRGDKPGQWERTHARPMQETIVSDGPETQSPMAEMPAGHPAISTDAPANSSASGLPKGHPPISNSPDAVVKLGGKPGDVDIEDMHWKAPKSWEPKEPSSRFVSAEFKLPKAEGDSADGRLTVSMVGGSVEQNIDRWRGQFGGKPEKQSTETFDVAGIKTTLIDFEGTFKEGGGPMMAAAAVDRPGYRMIAAVSQRNDTLIVVKATGPAKTIAAQADEIKAFVKSLKIDNRGDKRPETSAADAHGSQPATAQVPPGHTPVSPSPDSAAKPDSKQAAVDVQDMHWTAPKGWVSKEPSSRFVSAEFKLPKADDEADGRLTISMVGGGVEQNIDRWRGQFGGKPEKQSTETFDVSGIKTTLIDIEGTFKEGGGPMMAAAAVDRPGYRMIAAISQRNDTLIVVKATGPAKTMAARADEIKAFVKSLKIDK